MKDQKIQKEREVIQSLTKEVFNKDSKFTDDQKNLILDMCSDRKAKLEAKEVAQNKIKKLQDAMVQLKGNSEAKWTLQYEIDDLRRVAL